MKDLIANRMSKKKIIDLIFVIFIFSIDRLSKLLVIKSAEANGEVNFSVTSFLNFNLIWNEGIAFGLLSVNENFYYNIITLLIISITLIILIMVVKTSGIERYSFSMIFGGSLANIFDLSLIHI